MPQKNQKITRQLNRFDRKKKASQKAKAMARAMKKETMSWSADFGRTLPHYTPIHELLLKMSKGKIKGKTILHIASSTGLYTYFLQSKGSKAIGLDISENALRIAKKIKNKRLVRADAGTGLFTRVKHNSLPFRYGSIDFVVSDHFLFSDYPDLELFRGGSLAVLQEIHRILCKRGVAIINLEADEFNAFDALKAVQMGFEIIRPKPLIMSENLWHSPIQGMGLLVLRKK